MPLAAQTLQAALSSALRGTPASGIVLDIASGKRLAAVGDVSRPSAPGSVLKPLFLAAALEQNAVTPQTSVFCRRNLSIREGAHTWDVSCTHPPTGAALSAQEALAYSCNQYFVALADRLSPEAVSLTLQRYDLPRVPPPQSPQQKQLLVLGLAGIRVSPEEMATAYRRLALEFKAAASDAPVTAAAKGMEDSVRYGMAHNAAVNGLAIRGKTGTASDATEIGSHGWFAGTAALGDGEVVLVLYVPHGNGGDAAALAQRFFAAASNAKP